MEKPWEHGTREILGTASVSEVEKAVWGREVSLVGRTHWRESIVTGWEHNAKTSEDPWEKEPAAGWLRATRDLWQRCAFKGRVSWFSWAAG